LRIFAVLCLVVSLSQPLDRVRHSPPRGPDSRFRSSQFILTRLRFIHNNFRRQQSVKRTYDPPIYDPHQAVVSRKIFRLEPHPFSARFGYKYAEGRRGLMMMFFQTQRDEMKTIASGTWSLALPFWLCDFKDEAASPSPAAAFDSPGELPSPAQDSPCFSVRFHASPVLSLIEIREKHMVRRVFYSSNRFPTWFRQVTSIVVNTCRGRADSHTHRLFWRSVLSIDGDCLHSSQTSAPLPA
jgi:hypothetical protein